MKIQIMQVNQNDNIFYVGKIKAGDLIRISSTKIRLNKTDADYKGYLSDIDYATREKIDEGDIWYLKGAIDDPNIQRKESKKRMIEIGHYISSVNTIFPNSIIINLSLVEEQRNKTKYNDSNIFDYIDICENYIEFDEDKVFASIIDGQHRLGGFKYTDDITYYLEHIELVVTIMIGLEVSQQAELFSTINGKQKPVNKSVIYDLSGISEKEYTELVTAHLIVTWFNMNEKSPLRNKIKMLGYGDGSISQSAIIDAFLPLIEEKRLKPSIEIEDNLLLPIFRDAYLKSDSKYIIQNLYTYFSLFKDNFNYEWNYKYSRKDSTHYILNKTTGISGLLMAFPTLYCLEKDGVLNIRRFVENLRELKFDFSSEKYQGGSKHIQKQLALDMLNSINDNNLILRARNNFIENQF